MSHCKIKRLVAAVTVSMVVCTNVSMASLYGNHGNAVIDPLSIDNTQPKIGLQGASENLLNVIEQRITHGQENIQTLNDCHNQYGSKQNSQDDKIAMLECNAGVIQSEIDAKSSLSRGFNDYKEVVEQKRTDVAQDIGKIDSYISENQEDLNISLSDAKKIVQRTKKIANSLGSNTKAIQLSPEQRAEIQKLKIDHESNQRDQHIFRQSQQRLNDQKNQLQKADEYLNNIILNTETADYKLQADIQNLNNFKKTIGRGAEIDIGTMEMQSFTEMSGKIATTLAELFESNGVMNAIENGIPNSSAGKINIEHIPLTSDESMIDFIFQVAGENNG